MIEKLSHSFFFLFLLNLYQPLKNRQAFVKALCLINCTICNIFPIKNSYVKKVSDCIIHSQKTQTMNYTLATFLKLNKYKVYRIDAVKVTNKLISFVSAFRSNYLKTDCACLQKRRGVFTDWDTYLQIEFFVLF